MREYGRHKLLSWEAFVSRQPVSSGQERSSGKPTPAVTRSQPRAPLSAKRPAGIRRGASPTGSKIGSARFSYHVNE